MERGPRTPWGVTTTNSVPRQAVRRLALGGLAAGIAGGLGIGCRDSPLPAAALSGLKGSIFFVSEASGASKTYAMAPDGSRSRRLLQGDEPDFPYGVSADRSTVAVVRGRDGEHAVLLAGIDGSAPRVVADRAGIDGSPVFSPDGRWLLFESAGDSFRELYKLPLAGGDPVRLTNNPEGNFDGAWSPDGSRIAFASSRHGQLDLFIMAADGSAQTRLTSHPGDSIKPAWSPDGQWIAFVSGRDGNDDVYVVRPDGRDVTNLTGEQQVEERFAWRPDGAAIVYVTRARDGKRKLRLVELATRTDRALSRATDDDFDPSWAPDGAHLAFASQERRGHPDVWIMRSDGSRRTRVTRDPQGAWLPRWVSAELR